MSIYWFYFHSIVEKKMSSFCLLRARRLSTQTILLAFNRRLCYSKKTWWKSLSTTFWLFSFSDLYHTSPAIYSRLVQNGLFLELVMNSHSSNNIFVLSILSDSALAEGNTVASFPNLFRHGSPSSLNWRKFHSQIRLSW